MKHIGRQINPKRRAVVAYRVVPKESDQCLVVFTDSLESDAHDALMNLVESNAGQTAYELAEAMDRAVLPDGRNMLRAFAATGKFAKMPTDKIEMTPDMKNTVMLSELNEAIAKKIIIKTGKTQGDFVEILEGLVSNDVIVNEGARNVKDGQDVKILNTETNE